MNVRRVSWHRGEGMGSGKQRCVSENFVFLSGSMPFNRWEV